MVDEIQIHRTLNHPHIISFHGCLEDKMNVYIILELCTRQRPTKFLVAHFAASLGPLPSCLPTSCLVTPPRLDTLNITATTDTDRRPLAEKNDELAARPKEARVHPEAAEMSSSVMRGRQRQDYLKELQRLLQNLFSERPPERRFERPEEAEDPASLPVFWIIK
ncbi:hypothetical protein V5799_027686 [Amblyomma americanum]|uniref:Uncharacterized protein n=1 Tax=Amblyomma americanum TaxID=6943 RepID=A0AAQ4DF02_AMBAM